MNDKIQRPVKMPIYLYKAVRKAQPLYNGLAMRKLYWELYERAAGKQAPVEFSAANKAQRMVYCSDAEWEEVKAKAATFNYSPGLYLMRCIAYSLQNIHGITLEQ